MRNDVLPFLCAALLENSDDITHVCRDLQKKIEKSLEKIGWTAVASEHIRQVGENVRTLLIDESIRGATVTRYQIDQGILKDTQENRKLATPEGYIASDGEVMVLISLFDASRYDTDRRETIQSKLGSRNFSEALLAYAYLCAEEAKRPHEEPAEKCRTAAEALHFSRLRFITEQSNPDNPQKVSAKCKHFEEHKLVLHFHFALAELIPELISIENASLIGAIDLAGVRNELERQFSRFGASPKAVAKAIRDRCKQVVTRFARSELLAIKREDRTRKRPTFPAMRWMALQLDVHPRLPPTSNNAGEYDNYKLISHKVREHLPDLSHATICGWIRADTNQ